MNQDGTREEIKLGVCPLFQSFIDVPNNGKAYKFFFPLDNWEKKIIKFLIGISMEEIEISSWLTLDALKKKAEVVETVGNLQTGHSMSVFCQIEEDFLELVYSDSAANYLRRYEDKDEFEASIEERKEEDGETPFEEEHEFEEDYEEEEEEGEDYEVEDESDNY